MNLVHLHAQLAASDFPAPALADLFASAEEDFAKAPTMHATLRGHIDALLARKPPPFDAAKEKLLLAKLDAVAEQAGVLQAELAKEADSQGPIISRLKALEEQLATVEAARGEVLALRDVAAALSVLSSSNPPSRDAWMSALESLARAASVTPLYLVSLPEFARNKLSESSSGLVRLLEGELSAALKLMGWASAAQATTGWTVAQEASACECTRRLIRLQVLSLRNPAEELVGANVVWAVDVLVQPLLVRFQLHFCTDKRTNRIDRPEWAVGFCLQALKDARAFVADKIQPLAAEAGIFADVWSQFVRRLVLALHARVRQHAPHLVADPALLCHTVDELLSGDAVLMGELAYSESVDGAGEDWPLPSTVMLEPELLEGWVKADYLFTSKRLHAAMNSPEAWRTVKETFATAGDEPRDFTTPSSDALVAMLSSVAQRWATLPSSQARLKLFLSVLVPLVGDYLEAASQRPPIEACNALAHVIDGLEDARLSAAYLSLPLPGNVLESALDGGGGSSQSPAHTRELQRKTNSGNPSSESRQGRRLMKPLGFFTPSSSSSSSFSASAHTGPDRLIEQCTRALNHALDEEVAKGMGDFHRALGASMETKTWTFTAAASPNGGSGLSVEAAPGLASLKATVSLWERRLNPVARIKAEKALANAVGAYVRDCVLLARPFSFQGAQQLNKDVQALEAAFAFKQAVNLRELIVLVNVLALPANELKRQAAAGQPHAIAMTSRRVDL